VVCQRSTRVFAEEGNGGATRTRNSFGFWQDQRPAAPARGLARLLIHRAPDVAGLAGRRTKLLVGADNRSPLGNNNGRRSRANSRAICAMRSGRLEVWAPAFGTDQRSLSLTHNKTRAEETAGTIKIVRRQAHTRTTHRQGCRVKRGSGLCPSTTTTTNNAQLPLTPTRLACGLLAGLASH